jgi:DNA polymerase III subunit gamma/tau
MSEQYQVSARKYRPLRFEDVVGQEHIAGTLKNAMSQGKVAHAFLFCGPRGVGKTTCARILARTLNCLTPKDHEPCGTCSSCAAFQQGQSFNIVELDAASNNSVEHIRSLTEQVRFAPSAGKYKVFIIDEVHMLSAQAFNAFLKTLEEPPPYAIFILATTEKHKILPTILSRCQIFDFKRISIADAAAHLQAICVKEKITADPEALHVIGQKADGALRDALSIFDRVVSSAQGNLTYTHTIEQLNVLDADYFFRLTDLLLAEDHAEVLNLYDEVLTKGFDTEIFINGLAEHLRNVLLSKDARAARLVEVSETLQKRYMQQAAMAPESFLLSALSLLNECEINLRMARNRRLHTELYLLKLAYIGAALDWSKSSVPTTEKKKTDLVAVSQKASVTHTAKVVDEVNTLPPAAVPIPVAPAEASPVVVPDVVEQVSPTAAPIPVNEAPTIPTQAVHAPSSVSEPEPQRASLRRPEGQVRLSLDAFEEAVQVDSAYHASRVSQFDVEHVHQCWATYGAGSDSAILRSNMQMARLQIDITTKKINVLTHNGVARDMILQEKGLLDYLRSTLHEPLMLLSVTIDAAIAENDKPKQPARALNEREKYEQMAGINPALQTLRDTFDLKIVE